MIIEVKEEQWEKALLPILAMLLGIVTEVNDLQPLKACASMLLTPSGMTIDVKDLQLEKVYSFMVDDTEKNVDSIQQLLKKILEK